ncbi:hypothetical protein DYB35_011663 [Aphanomyces astaci]|uniref:WRKY transcription factor 19 n=1 Tax=Aphanomyces astaci TaxID=112090 RepID=A0A3R6WZC0_APHAT|nr:hypothetical protein DYB35_011663 [Aphanomyces astaci]
MQASDPIFNFAMVSCFFNDCHLDTDTNDSSSWKCAFHKHRSRCLVSDCHNQVYARNLCVRHGGKRACVAPGCSANARVGNLCSKHATPATKKLCMVDGCTKQAHARYKCVRHGGGSQCKAMGCISNSRSNGMCSRHAKAHHKDRRRDESRKIDPGDGKDAKTVLMDDLLQPIAFDHTPAYFSTDLLDVVVECFSVIECDVVTV